MSDNRNTPGIAVVGMAVRTPGAADLESFWQALIEGRDCISHFADCDLDPLVPEALRRHPHFVAARGVLEQAECFDAALFGMSANQARLMDPQQRVFLELCWHALEHAGLDPLRSDGSIGVYAGSANNTWLATLRQSMPELIEHNGEFAAMLANEKDYIATRVAHKLNLDGPAIGVYTACSSSLVAIAQAWYALMNYQCDAALAGGICVIEPQAGGYLSVEGGMDSPDGACRPFDADARGTVFSSGGGCVVLKRVEDALEAGDTIHAVIRGVGVNNDGADKASFTAPNPAGQAAAIRLALTQADVEAASIGYVEAHGTGTALGDPIEVTALRDAFALEGRPANCVLGSVKGNIGHLTAAAGVVGLIKAVLCLEREQIPPTAHFRKPNPRINFDVTPFQVLGDVRDWPRGDILRRAGVSSFGVGGTNAHVVLEEGIPQPVSATRRSQHVLPLSANGKDELEILAKHIGAVLGAPDAAELADAASTLAGGRKQLSVRCAVVAGERAEAISRLNQPLRVCKTASAPRQIWLFPGQGSQFPGMAADLWRDEPDFRSALDPLLTVADTIDAKLRTLLLDADPADEKAAARLAQTELSQPALFMVSYAMARTLEAYGLTADAMVGHSIGEYVAACLAGVFSPEQTLKLVARRGALMQAQPHGDMVAVHATVDGLRPYLTENIAIACYNAEALQVVSGSHQAMQVQLAELEKREFRYRRLKVSHAFHSPLMDGTLQAFTEAVAAATPAAPQRMFYACPDGQPIRAGQATDPAYWAGQIRAPVRFADSLRHALSADRPALLLEVGPGHALSALAPAARGADGQKPHAVIAFGASANGKDDEAGEAFACALGECWAQGAHVDLEHRYAGETRHNVPLPGYPFRRDPYGYTRPSTNASIAETERTTISETPVPASDDDAVATIVALLAEVSGEPAETIDPSRNFVSLGLDSLLLTQFSLALEQKLGLKLRFRRLLEDLGTPEKLAAHARAELPAETWATPAAAAAVPQSDNSPSAGRTLATPESAGIQALLASQLQMLEQQTQLLRGLTGVTTSGQPTLPAARAAACQSPAASESVAGPNRTHSAGFGASARINLEHGIELEPEQQRWLNDFIGRYTRRTGASRDFTQRHRRVMADPRAVTGFDPRWKEMVYPLVADRSRGARLWDLDGNEYIDLLNGFGSNFLGYQPPCIAEALKEQIDAGYEIGPQHPLAAEVSELIAGFTGLPRVALCNTGSEAVMGAMRVARTVTGRDTIAIFRDSYHGIFDEALVRGTSRFEARPAAPGITPSAVQHVLILDYGSDEALEILRQRGNELAAIMIEPIQARHPELRPRAFVEALRDISDQAGCALIFDEVITGFRVEPGGAQAYFGVKADIATYGKIIGGGLPFAAIAGEPHWMDALDGGDWRFGDDSQPEAGVTYFAGTFVRHPLALAAARASLKHLDEAGPALQESLNRRTAQLTERLNRHFRERHAPIEAVSFSSMWRLRVDDGQALASLLFYLLRYRGLHLYEQFGCFLSTAHGEAECDQIAERIEQAVDELLDLGLLRTRHGQVAPLAPSAPPPAPTTAPTEVPVTVDMGGTVNAPMTAGQLEKWVVCQHGEKAVLAYNEGVLLHLHGKLDRNALRLALEDLWMRHEALRISIDGDRESQSVSDCVLPFEEVDLSGADDSSAGQAARIEAWSREQMATPFDLATAPLLRVHLLRLGGKTHVLHLVGHHLVLDGWSLAVFVRELAVCYNARRVGREPELPPATSFVTYARNEKARRGKSDAELAFWQRELAGAPEPLALGHGDDSGSRLSFDADTFQRDFPAASLAAVRHRAGLTSVTPFSVLLSAFAILLWRLSGQRDVVLCIPFAGQAMVGAGNMIGDGVNTLPLRIRIDPTENLSQLLKRVHTQLLDAADHQDTTLLSIARRLNEQHRRGGEPLSRIIFNLNPHIAPPHFDGLDARLRDCRRSYLAWDLFFNFYDTGSDLTLDLHYDSKQFNPDGLGQWMTTYAGLLDGMGGDADPIMRDLAVAEESFQLTEAQRDMCAAVLMGNDANCACNQCFVLTLQGPLSPESLRKALTEVVQRHGALRLRLDVHTERQHLLPAVEIELPVIDLRAEDETVRQTTIAQLLDHETRTPFDLNVAPLWRALLVRETDDRHRFVFTAHHLVVDGWSSAVIFSDLARSYAADRLGAAAKLPPAAPYGEFVLEQLGPAVAAETEAATEYWANRFSGGAPALELPVDAPRPAVKTYAAGRQVLTIDKNLYRALRKIAVQQRTTLFVTLLAAFEVLLARLGSAEELVIGVPMASQALQDNEHLVAHGVNTLPLLCRVDPQHSFKDHLLSTHNAFFEAQTHQRLTFGTLVRKLRLPRDPSRIPLISVIFNMNKLGSPFDFGEVAVASVDAPKAFYNFELGINAIDSGESLLLECDYNADLFKAATIKRWLSHYREILKGISAVPATLIAQLPLLTPDERKQILVDWNATRLRTDGDMRLHRLFEAQAARSPQAEALVTTTERCSYAELNARANRFAHQLRRLGVGKEILVGVCLRRSVDLVAALLAVLKSGGAYVPLDPNYPADRIAFMLKDSQARLLITTADLRDVLPTGEARLLLIDRNPGIADCPDTDPENETQPHDLAYVIYTSGSTGVPKGVAIEHFSAATLVHWAATVFPDTALRGVLAATSVCFDLSIFEIFFTLSHGGRMILAENALQLLEHPARNDVTLIDTVPSAVAELLRADGLPDSVATVCLAGEPLPTRLVDQLYDTGHVKHVYDLYGPSEATTYSTWTRRERGLPATIGRPIANARAYVLDSSMNPTPIGVAGQLFLGGDGLARGYLNRPELTAERFVRDPFLEGTGNRIYRTGDLARYRPDGELEYLGRLDHQIKLRGLRIEPGEIEARLTEHPAVREATVLALGEGTDKRLVAYVIADASPDLAASLREHLGTRLPEYMVPAAFVRLDAFPLTPNGKLDRRALPDPDGDAFARKDYEPPRGDIEVALAAIWTELLGVERIGRHDHFFELGGHSLLMARLVNRVASLGVELPLATLFSSLVFADFARVVGERWTGSQTALPAIAHSARDGGLPLSFAQQRLWFLAQLEGSNDTYRIPLALRLHGRLDHAAFHRALAAVFARHDALRSTFVERSDDEPEVRLLDAGLLPYRENDLRGVADADETLRHLCDEEAHVPFDLARGPLMRARLIQMADDEHVVLLTQHHIVFDGWSFGVLARELSALYTAFAQNRPDPLPPLAIQYSDYAAWQHEWLSDERLREHADYWREALAEAPALISLPTDRPRPAQQAFEGGEVPIRLDADLTRALKRLGQQHGTTPFMTLLAAWATVLARLSGQNDLVIGTPSANRGRAEVEPLIGCFINTLALRVDLSDAPTTAELLDRVRRTVLAAQDHQNLPFEQVVDILQPPRRIEHTPLFQVMFTWQTNEAASFDLPGVRVDSVNVSDDTVKFDLELALGEVDDEIVGTFSYARSLFDATTIERHRDYLFMVLRAMVTEADRSVHRINLLSPAERTLLLETRNRTDTPYPRDLCIHQLFEQQVERSPDAIAVVFEDQCLSYGELNARANRLAHELIGHGVTPDARVAICVERSLAMVVGLLAILKAGGAYVPMDPAYPGERLTHVLTDAQPCLLIADAAGLDALGRDAIGSLTVVNPEKAELDHATGGAANPCVPELTARHLAYVIYTSGSTGAPKGVMVEHRNVVNFLLSMSASPGISSKDRLLAVTSMSFDIAALELYLPLSQGAQAVLASRADVADPARLDDLIEQHAISVVQATPATWRMLLPLADHARRDLVALCGGEALTSSLSARLEDTVSSLWNLYGPTETTIWSTCMPIAHDEKTNAPSESIGRPIANTRIYLLDEYRQPVPLGAAGEIYIGGAGVARGYFNRPNLTAERFLPDPFSPHPHARMYKTGDLAHYAAEGDLVFLGRNDHQIKVRGFRIEPGEIEARLTEHPAVREATVLALGEDTDKRLVAYVVADASPDLAAGLREHLSARLPEYMVPAAFVRLDAFPLTSNGKLDRRALPMPADTPTMVEHVAPRSPSEALVVAAFNDVLERSDVGIFDDFFDLGGHSLLAAHMIANLRASTKVDLPLRNLFEQPTPERLAATIDALAWAAGSRGHPTANDHSDREEFAL